jgi:hypothetical protein
VAVVGVQVRPDEVPQCPLRPHVSNVAGAGEDEAEPEAEEGRSARDTVVLWIPRHDLSSLDLSSHDLASLAHPLILWA